MACHNNAITGDGEIEFDRRHPDSERMRESGQGVFRHQTTRTAVTLQVEVVRGGTHRHQACQYGRRKPVPIHLYGLHRPGRTGREKESQVIELIAGRLFENAIEYRLG